MIDKKEAEKLQSDIMREVKNTLRAEDIRVSLMEGYKATDNGRVKFSIRPMGNDGCGSWDDANEPADGDPVHQIGDCTPDGRDGPDGD